MKKHLLSLVAISMMIATTIQAQVPTNGLIAWYPFTGNAIDSSGNGNNGTVNGATLTTDRFGNVNSAYSFNGATSNILIPNTLISNTPSSYSISLWFKIDTLANSNGNSPMLISDRSTGLSSYKYTIAMRVADSTIETGIYDGSSPNGQGVANTKIKDKNWHHVIQIFNSSSKILSQYIDGTFTGSFNNVSQWSTKSNPTFIGMWNGFVGYSGYFKGKIDDIRIYNRAIDSTEIQGLYHEGGYASVPTSGLIAWYPFSGNTKDSSGNNYNGVANQIVYTVDRFGNPNTAININGNMNSYVDVTLPDTSKLTNELKSFSFWINFPKTYSNGNYYNHIITTNTPTKIPNGNLCYIQIYGSYPSYVSSGYVNKLGFTGIAPISNVTFNNSTWMNVTLVCDGINNTVAEYVNGKYVSTESTQQVNYTNWTGLRFGQNYGNLSQCTFSGMIDDIRIYNRALDSVEVEALYHENGYGNTLPLRITDLTASYINKKTLINWSTATELNASYFIIQHSTDGTSFSEIGKVKAVGKGSNSYQFVDDKAIIGTNYYRLESVDMDGAATYSKVVSVQYANAVNLLKVYPNPVRSTLTISGEHIAMVQILDNMGRVVNTQSLHDATNPLLSVSNLATGVYHVRIQTTDNKTSTIGFVKQ